MPTGYTYKIKEGISFNEFIMLCARAFGACVMLRDEPEDKPIPERFEPSDWHLKELQKAKERLHELSTLTLKDAALRAREDYDKEFADYDECLAERTKLEKQYRAMLRHIRAWEPPSPDHVQLKKFMDDQVSESIKWDCEGEVSAPMLRPASQWLKEAKESAQHDVTYHAKENEMEIERTKQRNTWLKQLRESLYVGK